MFSYNATIPTDYIDDFKLTALDAGSGEAAPLVTFPSIWSARKTEDYEMFSECLQESGAALHQTLLNDPDPIHSAMHKICEAYLLNYRNDPTRNGKYLPFMQAVFAELAMHHAAILDHVSQLLHGYIPEEGAANYPSFGKDDPGYEDGGYEAMSTLWDCLTDMWESVALQQRKVKTKPASKAAKRKAAQKARRLNRK